MEPDALVETEENAVPKLSLPAVAVQIEPESGHSGLFRVENCLYTPQNAAASSDSSVVPDCKR